MASYTRTACPVLDTGGNGHKPDAAIVTEHDLLWDGLSPVVTKALGEPLDPALVSQRKGRAGRKYDYIEGHVVIDQANRIFGYGGWGMELVGDVTLRQVETVDTQTGEVKVTYAYSAPVRVTVPGAPPRTDTGFHAVTEDNAEGHETAIKAAVTDGMKRALRTFGVQFGNALYGDKPPVGNTPRPERVPAQSQASRRTESQVHNLRKQLIEIRGRAGLRRGRCSHRRRGPDGQEHRRPDGCRAGSSGRGPPPTSSTRCDRPRPPSLPVTSGHRNERGRLLEAVPLSI